LAATLLWGDHWSARDRLLLELYSKAPRWTMPIGLFGRVTWLVEAV